LGKRNFVIVRSYHYINIISWFRRLVSSLLVVSLIVTSGTAYANSKYAALIIDADTGVVLHQENAGKFRYPASLTKMMSIYVAFQALKSRSIRMNQKVKVSRKAAAQPPSKLGLKPGSYITVRDLITAMIVKSANDAAVVLAEGVAGSEWKFAMLMNKMARKLGMKHTTFRNASGLHDRRQRTTAYDIARLSVALRRDFPQYYYLFGKKKFFYRGKLYETHNKVLKTYVGTDGLKTGYVRASGYNLVTSVQRSGDRLIGVVMGGRSGKRRDRAMKKLLDRSFAKLASRQGRKAIRTSIPVPKPKPKNRSSSSHSVAQQNKAVSSINEQAQPSVPFPVLMQDLVPKEKPIIVSKRNDHAR
jgi:D-alanyl-D-alanine carboxypeptidase